MLVFFLSLSAQNVSRVPFKPVIRHPPEYLQLLLKSDSQWAVCDVLVAECWEPSRASVQHENHFDKKVYLQTAAKSMHIWKELCISFHPVLQLAVDSGVWCNS